MGEADESVLVEVWMSAGARDALVKGPVAVRGVQLYSEGDGTYGLGLVASTGQARSMNWAVSGRDAEHLLRG